MRLLMIGPPGSGKGTQAERIAAHFGITHISSGDLLRAEISAQTEVGRAAAPYVERGDLVPDELVVEMLQHRVWTAALAGGYVLDGFPRTAEQARLVEGWVETAILLEVPRAELAARLLARGQGRADDTREVINHRMDLFEATIPALLGCFDRVVRVNGARPIDEVTASIIDRL